MMIAVRVERVTLDTTSNRFVVILRDDSNNQWLPIVVGPAEAQAIALQLEQIAPPRPMTHDLIKNLLKSVDANVSQVVVTDLKDNTYYATIDLKNNGNMQHVDARPSDAIAIALRTNAPIFVDDKVMKQAAISDDVDTSDISIQDEIQSLNTQLQQAVQEERYEDAARFRDMITAVEEKQKSKPKGDKKK